MKPPVDGMTEMVRKSLGKGSSSIFCAVQVLPIVFVYQINCSVAIKTEVE
jgi:hypothetical protein